MVTRSPREVSESYWAAECRRDIEAVVDHYHPDATYEGPDGLRSGHVEISAAYEEHARLFPGLEVEIGHEFPGADWSAIEFDAVLRDTAGKRYRIRGVNVVHVRDGKFVSVRSYEDPPTLLPTSRPRGPRQALGR
jgi:ketosteroid isomerase-like protein